MITFDEMMAAQEQHREALKKLLAAEREWGVALARNRAAAEPAAVAVGVDPAPVPDNDYGFPVPPQVGLCPKCRAAVGDPDKVALLEHYAMNPVNLFDQYDGFLNGADSISDAGDGDALFNTVTWESRKGIDLRIQILGGTSKQDALRLLRKMLKWIERSYCPVTAADAPQRPAQEALGKSFSVPDGIPF